MLKFIEQQCMPNNPQNRIHGLQYTVKTNSECWEEKQGKGRYSHNKQSLCTCTVLAIASDVINCTVWLTADHKQEILKPKS